ncbi:hypothetical protein BDY21DRAFT_284949 [Lineolata rhizophorae]|uniref:Pentatricopeptide repeat protein n=1 Tax=Lineolata rhizophorae TaxID=578093 RepID=A0A6A6P206_9PEZI|nr:hypothetical protein BDY21DRAFT_284949 [Lineolata rhizophorae]
MARRQKQVVRRSQTARPAAAAKARRGDGEDGEEGEDGEGGGGQLSVAERGKLRRELQYLKDPLHFAEHVRKLLRKQEKEEWAVALLRLASKQMRCTVGWNHLIDHQMGQDKVKAALKSFNEMKKRGQKPDSHTYLLMFRGLAYHAHYPQALTKAISLYHAMHGPQSTIKPSIIHSNAVIKVCARAGDMDALWGVVAKLTENGSGSADTTTYTTILNAMRTYALKPGPRDIDADQVAESREEIIIQGRQMWEDIIRRWRAGDLLLDTRTVCAMGRLLLIGSRPRDWDDVLSLVQQTMNITRLVPRLGTEARSRAGVPQIRAPYTPKSMKDDSVFDDGAHAPGSEFASFDAPTVVQTGRKKNGSFAYVRPDNNTLSLILEACLKTIAKNPAVEYMDLLTDPDTYGIVPDADNVHIYLRILRQSRSSAAAAELLQDLEKRSRWKKLAFPFSAKTFRIAMSAAVRDKNNPNALAKATTMVDIMGRSKVQFDARSAAMYVDLASEADVDGKAAVAALERFNPDNYGLRQLAALGRGIRGKLVSSEERVDVIDLLKRLQAAYDRLFERKLVPEEQKEEVEEKRKKVSAIILQASQNFKQGQRSGGGRKGRKGTEANEDVD